MDLIALITDVAAPIAVAVFAIWMLRESMQRRIEDREKALEEERERTEAERERRAEERSELVRVIERNSDLWQQTTRTMAELASASAMMVTAVCNNEEHVSVIREMLASRPCIMRGSGERQDDP